MKLPSDTPNDGELQAGSSPYNTGSGAEGASGSNQGPSATFSGGTSEEGGRSAQASSTSGSSTQEVDFSEYLWMENEEEFDTQVLQELEDEEMINYYYELYEASLNENGTWGPNTANLRVTGPPPPYAPDAARGSQGNDPVDSLAQGISNRLNFGSSSGGSCRLNPEAAEFVPRTTNMSSPN